MGGVESGGVGARNLLVGGMSPAGFVLTAAAAVPEGENELKEWHMADCRAPILPRFPLDLPPRGADSYSFSVLEGILFHGGIFVWN